MTSEITKEPDYAQETLSRYRFKIIWDKSKMSPEGIKDYGEDGADVKNQLENFRNSSSFKQNIVFTEQNETENRWEWTLRMTANKEDFDSLKKRYSNPDLGLSFEVLP